MPLEWKAPPNLLPADRGNVGAVFETIYNRNIWGGGSGAGSNPQIARDYMNFLQAFLANNNIRSVVDIGCGDWQFSQFINFGNASYLGIDVVPSVIAANQQRFGVRANTTFVCANPLDGSYQVPGGDLLLMKDVLQHLSNANVAKLLALTRRFKFALITNAYAPVNDDCENGDTRPLDIRVAPFNLAHAAIVFAFREKAVFLTAGEDKLSP
jgi:SAM-dependent methyltransferase